MGVSGTSFSGAAMRRLAIITACGAAALCAPANAAEFGGTANAAVVQPLSLVKTDDLDFGTMISGTTGGTVTVNASTNARTTTGGVTTVGGGAQRATFLGAARIGLIVTITGSNSATLSRAGGGATPMTASLTRTFGSGLNVVTLPLVGTVTVVATGVQTYYVGGTLTVPANQPDGDYSGTFTLTVNYL